MKAAVWTGYGPPDVLRVTDVEKPSIRKGGEVLIRVRATAASTGDCELRRMKLPSLGFRILARLYFGVLRPRGKILGIDFAGQVEAVGKGVTRFKAGDEVFGTSGLRLGAYAEYVCLPEGGVMAMKPSNMTFEEAAAIPMGGLNALRFLRRANVQRGQKVLVNGAGGSIGAMAVQLAKAWGAEVTAVDGPGKLDVLRSIGADRVLDYTKEDFTKRGDAYDVILDVIGKSSFAGSLRSLKERGCYLIANPRRSQKVRGRWTSMTTTKEVFCGAPTETAEDLVVLKGFIEAGTIKAVIDRRYPLAEIAKAHAYVETGQKKGNVVITIEPAR